MFTSKHTITSIIKHSLSAFLQSKISGLSWDRRLFVVICTSHHISISLLVYTSGLPLPISVHLGTDIQHRQLYCGKYIEAHNLGHDAIICCMVSYVLPHTRQLGLTVLSVIPVPLFAHIYPSTCDEKVDVFIHFWYTCDQYLPFGVDVSVISISSTFISSSATLTSASFSRFKIIDKNSF